MQSFNKLLDVDIGFKVTGGGNFVPWVEKYRPKKLSEIVYQDDVVKMLKKVVETGVLPHLLFWGTPGSGKCLHPNTPVLTHDKIIKKAKNICVGDVLMGDDCKPRNVLGVTYGQDIMYKIIQQTGINYIVNSEHILSLQLMKPYFKIWNKNKQEYKIIWFENNLQKEIYTKDLFDIERYLVSADKQGKICDIPVTQFISKSKYWKRAYHGYQSRFVFDDKSKQRLMKIAKSNGYICGEILIIVQKIRKRAIRTMFLAKSLGYYVKQKLMKNKYVTKIYKEARPNALKVVKLNVGKYNGFELDGNGRFLLGDGTVTHNTSSILAIAMELFGPKKFGERVIEMNASDERGINIVRNKIVPIVKSAVSAPDPNYPCPNYKIIILDEADAMTNDAQSALKKIMEDYSGITRFCFICNYINQIIEPIKSRCVRFRFKPLTKQSMIPKFITIVQNEGLEIEPDALDEIAKPNITNGDMRKAITTLQKLKYLQKKITVDDVREISNCVPEHFLDQGMLLCFSECNIKEINDFTNKIFRTAYPIQDVLMDITERIINDDNLNDLDKSKICMHLSKVEKRLLDGSDEYLQLLSVFMCIRATYHKVPSIYDMSMPNRRIKTV